MSDEEKEIIKFLKIFVKTNIDYCKLEKNDVLAILNLIEKQQKEIEELKPIFELFKNASENAVEIFRETLHLENYISKDKIKAKIEDLKENSNGDDFNLTNVIMILQSLLEKE